MEDMQTENQAEGKLIAGVDEAGRGPLAGPVVAAAVILDENNGIVGLGDSKTISEKRRKGLAEEIRSLSIAWATAQVEHEEIDDLNILNASMLAMQRAVQALPVKPHHVQVDGHAFTQCAIGVRPKNLNLGPMIRSECI